MAYYPAINRMDYNTCENTNESQKYFAKWKKPATRDYLLYYFTYTEVLGKAKL